VYNQGPYLQPCITSPLAQTLPSSEYELIFIDDGSADEAPAAVDRLAEDQPGLVRVKHIENSGWPGDRGREGRVAR